MYSESNIEYQSYVQVMNFFTRGSSCKKFKNILENRSENRSHPGHFHEVSVVAII